MPLSQFYNYLSESERSVFGFTAVMDYIAYLYLKENELMLMTIQLDEFQLVNIEVMNHMLAILGYYMVGYNRKICISVQLTGTDSTQGITMISASKMPVSQTLLGPLKVGEDIEVITKSMGSNWEFLYSDPAFLEAVDTLGRVPRYIEFFIKGLWQVVMKSDITPLLSSVLKGVAVNMKDIYFEKYKLFLGQNSVGPRQMILWALSGRKVQLDDLLNGVTIRSAADSGILIVIPDSMDKTATLYTIYVPYILIRALNLVYNDIEDEYLNPLNQLDEHGFEKSNGALRLLRQNMYHSTGHKTVSLSDLYPSAIGRDEDLTMQIPIAPLTVVNADGAFGHINKLPLTTGKIIDLSKVKPYFSLTY